MNRIATFLSVSLMVSALAVPVLAQTDNTEPRSRRAPGRRPGVERQDAQQSQLAQRLQKQIDELKAAHQDLIAALRAIHDSAVKEKAAETADQVKKLIGKQQETFQSTLRQLELQQQRLQRAARDRAGRIEQARRRSRQAPDFELNSFDGKSIKLSNYKDDIVVLEWFNMECPFVQYHYDRTTTMIDLAKKYKDKNVVWLAVNSTNHTTPEANREFAQKHKLPYPILDDRSGKVGRLYGALTTPHMFIIDRGYIAYDGAIDNAPLGKPKDDTDKVNYVDKALSELLSGELVSTPNTQSYGCSVKYASQ